jgi:secreted trypsin-like serine protease
MRLLALLSLTVLVVPGQASARFARRVFDGTALGGERASDGHDAVVAMLNERGFVCSGVLIHPRAVLTAQHCGAVKRAVFGNDVGALRSVRAVTRVNTLPNRAIDLELLELDRDAPVEPYALGFSDVPREALRLVGFGCVDQECRRDSGTRSYFDIAARRDEWSCDASAAVSTGCIPGFELVLPRSEGDTCRGDSGSPLLARRGEGWVVSAITSRAAADSLLDCGDGGIHVRLAPHERWLVEHLEAL